MASVRALPGSDLKRMREVGLGKVSTIVVSPIHVYRGSGAHGIIMIVVIILLYIIHHNDIVICKALY